MQLVRVPAAISRARALLLFRSMSVFLNQVVVAFDFSHSGCAALERAVALASRAPFHVLHFVCVLDPHHALPKLPVKHVDLPYADRVREELLGTVQQELKAANIEQIVHFHIHVHIARNPAKEILAVAEEVGADLIIVGCKGITGLERVVLGSVSERIVREAKCAVVIARRKDYPYVEHVDVVEAAPHAHKTSSRHTYETRIAPVQPMTWPT
jgi:nucleotide-binding universal stress UspA family protein